MSFFVNLKKKVKFKGIVNTKRSFDAKVVYRQGTVARGIARQTVAVLNYGDTPGKKNQCLNDKIYKDVTEKEDSELFKLVVVPDVVVTVYALHRE